MKFLSLELEINYAIYFNEDFDIVLILFSKLIIFSYLKRKY